MQTAYEILHSAFLHQPLGYLWGLLFLLFIVISFIQNLRKPMNNQSKPSFPCDILCLSADAIQAIRTSILAGIWESRMLLSFDDDLLAAAVRSGQFLSVTLGLCLDTGPVDVGACRSFHASRLVGLEALLPRVEEGSNSILGLSEEEHRELMDAVHAGIREAKVMLAMPPHVLAAFPEQVRVVGQRLGIEAMTHHDGAWEDAQGYFGGRERVLEALHITKGLIT
jgi:hypothetical protein